MREESGGKEKREEKSFKLRKLYKGVDLKWRGDKKASDIRMKDISFFFFGIYNERYIYDNTFLY